MRISRRQFLAAAGVGLSGAVAEGMWREPHHQLVVRHHTIGSADDGPRCRLVQLSDLHLQKIGGREQRVLEAVHESAPDLLLITGDAVDKADRTDILRTFLDDLPATGHRVAILGNWEHWAGVDLKLLDALYSSARTELLVNRTVRLDHQGRSLLLTGIDDATGGRPDPRYALSDAEPCPNHLLLAHSPGFRDQLTGLDLLSSFTPTFMLSGHTHGGQVNLFGWAPLLPPGSGRYVAGWYDGLPMPLYVSQGIGTSVLPVRFGAAPEVAVFDWYLRA